MKRSLRAACLVATLAVAGLAIQAGLAVDRDAAGVVLEFISPPIAVALPAGQAIEVRYRANRPAATVELWVDKALLAADPVVESAEITHTWAPAERGARRLRLRLRALGSQGAVLAEIERPIMALPWGTTVRLDER